MLSIKRIILKYQNVLILDKLNDYNLVSFGFSVVVSIKSYLTPDSSVLCIA